MPRALITGITGQDGHYLSALLLGEGYEVFGLTRRAGEPAAADGLAGVTLIQGDLQNQGSLERALDRARPDELYNLAGFTSARLSIQQPVLTADSTALGPLRLLEAVRLAGAASTRIFQASSSEMFGAASGSPQSESSPFDPRNPYGVAKVFAHQACGIYRSQFGMYAVGGILFNHESPLRTMEYVSRKITHSAAAIKQGRLDRLELGDLDAERDWGFAGDYVRAMRLMLRRDVPQDFVIGTGETHTVRDFAARAFAHVGLDWRDHVVSSATDARPKEDFLPRADPGRARRELGWSPEVGLDELVALMTDSAARLLAGG